MFSILYILKETTHRLYILIEALSSEKGVQLMIKKIILKLFMAYIKDKMESVKLHVRKFN